MLSPRPVLILQLRPEDSTADSEYKCILKYGGLRPEDTQRLRIENSGIPGDIVPDNYSAIIVGGSPFDISTPEDKKSTIQKKIESDFDRFLEQVIARDLPFLGACSGNGLLGKFLGVPITRRYGEPVSLTSVRVTDEGKKDKLLQGFPEQIDVLLGHKEAPDYTPKGTTLLITGSACPVQMFRVGQNVYATQFHPEGDVEEFQLRIDIYKNYGYFSPDEAAVIKAQVSERPTPYGHEILKRFVDFYHKA